MVFYSCFDGFWMFLAIVCWCFSVSFDFFVIVFVSQGCLMVLMLLFLWGLSKPAPYGFCFFCKRFRLGSEENTGVLTQPHSRQKVPMSCGDRAVV